MDGCTYWFIRTKRLPLDEGWRITIYLKEYLPESGTNLFSYSSRSCTQQPQQRLKRSSHFGSLFFVAYGRWCAFILIVLMNDEWIDHYLRDTMSSYTPQTAPAPRECRLTIVSLSHNDENESLMLWPVTELLKTWKIICQLNHTGWYCQWNNVQMKRLQSIGTMYGMVSDVQIRQYVPCCWWSWLPLLTNTTNARVPASRKKKNPQRINWDSLWTPRRVICSHDWAIYFDGVQIRQELWTIEDSRLKECSRKWSNKKINRCGDRTVILILILVIYSYISDFHMNSIHVEQVKGKMLETSSTIEHSEVNAFICHNSSTTTSWNTTNTTILLLSTRWKWTQRSKTLTIKQCSFPMVMANTMFSEQVVSLKPPYKT